MFRQRIEVRFRDCDPMGHVNNAVYFTYLEHARFGWWQQLRRAGAGFTKEAGVILARAECDFRAPAKYGDVLEVEVRVTAIGRSSFTCGYDIVNAADGTVVATARTVQVTYDYTAGRAVPVPEALRAWLEQHRGVAPGTAGGVAGRAD